MSTIKKKVSYLFVLIIAAVAWRLLAGFLWGSSLGPGSGLLALVVYWPFVLALLIIPCWPLAAALALAARRMGSGVWIFAGILMLAGLFLPASALEAIFPHFLILSLALVVAALLLSSGLNLYKAWRQAKVAESGGSQAPVKQDGRSAAASLGLSALLLVKALHNLYWLTVWDNTYDPLGYLWLVFPILAALCAGVFLFIALPDRVKPAGYFYSLLVLALLIGVSARAQRVDFRQLTEERAGRVSQAVESYYAQERRYPQDLRPLTPWYALSLPGPVIIYGQAWCYDSGDDYYRLGYVYSEHWSDPRLSGRVYKAKGEVPDLQPLCKEEIAAIQERYPDYPYSYWTGEE